MESFIEKIKNKARANKKTIVLAEGNDIRMIQAAACISQEGFANVILLGDEERIKSEELDLSGVEIINPKTSDKAPELAAGLCEIRKSKGMTEDEAKALLNNELYFGVMLVKSGYADGMVAGAVNSTPDVLRPCLQIIKTAPRVKIVSSFFVMIVPNCTYGNNGTFIYSDCGLFENPNSDELSEIAIMAAKSYEALIGSEARVGMLSYSTYGSAKGELVDKVKEATAKVREKAPSIKVDGDLQLDAAIIPEIAASKAKGSEVAGSCNVLIFPDINAGNIGYKLTERLAKAEAYGPLTQGMALPVNDLSRGCTAADIVGVAAITAVQAQSQQ